MADVSIDVSISTSTARGQRSQCWHPTDDQIGYQFYIDSGGQFVYSKTTDGGATWGAPVTISSTTTHVAFDIWPAWWTPGVTSTEVYIVYFDTTADDLFVDRLDVSTDTLVQLNFPTLASAVAGIGAHCSITYAPSGNLYISAQIDAGAETGFWRSVDGGITWTARTSVFLASPSGDWSQLFPAMNTGDTDDVLALYFDSSANSLLLRWHDNSANTWTSSSSIATVAENTTDLTGQFPFSASIRHSDGHLILAVITERDTATSDHRVFDLDRTSGAFSVTEKTAITTNIDDHYYPSVFIDQTTDDIYVAYNGKRDGSEVLGANTGIYYTKSTDGGATWSAGDTAYMESSPTAWLQTWAPLMGPRFYVAGRFSSTQLWGNAVNSVTFGASTSPITGSSAVAFSESATLTGKGALAGSSAPAFTNTGTLRGKGALAGSSTPTFTATGTLRVAPSQIVGSSSLAFANSATLIGKGRLLGTSSPAFAPSGTLRGKGALLGTSSPAFNLSATLRGKGSLTGTAAVAFTNSAALTADGALAGSVSLAFSTTGTLTDGTTANDAITGTSDLNFTASGTLSGKGALAGASSPSFTLTGGLRGKGLLAGSSSLSFTATAVLTGKGALAGSSAMAFTTGGDLTEVAPGALAGAGTVSFTASGTLTGMGALSGSAHVSFSATGNLSNVGVQPIVVGGGGPDRRRPDDEEEWFETRAKAAKKRYPSTPKPSPAVPLAPTAAAVAPSVVAAPIPQQVDESEEEAVAVAVALVLSMHDE